MGLFILQAADTAAVIGRIGVPGYLVEIPIQVAYYGIVRVIGRGGLVIKATSAIIKDIVIDHISARYGMETIIIRAGDTA
jgi:hypothetical protein